MRITQMLLMLLYLFWIGREQTLLFQIVTYDHVCLDLSHVFRLQEELSSLDYFSHRYN